MTYVLNITKFCMKIANRILKICQNLQFISTWTVLVTGLDKFVFVAVQVNSACRKDRSMVRNWISFLTVPFRNTVNESSIRRPDLDQVRRGGGIP